jgi:hypothetical protein
MAGQYRAKCVRQAEKGFREATVKIAADPILDAFNLALAACQESPDISINMANYPERSGWIFFNCLGTVHEAGARSLRDNPGNWKDPG